MSNEEKRFFVLYHSSEPRAEYNLETQTVRVTDSAPQLLAPELIFDIDEETQQAEQDALFGMRDGKIDPAVYEQIYTKLGEDGTRVAKAEYRGGPVTLRQAMAEVLFHAGEAVSLGPNEHGVCVTKEQVQQLCGLDATADPNRLKRVINQVIDRAFANGNTRRSANQRFLASAEAASLAAKISVTADEMKQALATDLRNIFFTRDADRLPSALLVIDLALQGDRWSKFVKDQPITVYQLGQQLRLIGIESKVFHIRKKDRWAVPGLAIGDNVRGFTRSQLDDLFKSCDDTKPEQVLIYQPVQL